jgi:hypothetical protein
VDSEGALRVISDALAIVQALQPETALEGRKLSEGTQMRTPGGYTWRSKDKGLAQDGSMAGLAFESRIGYLGLDAAEEHTKLDASAHYRR